jgi:16S rRNA (guanine966-N2)-methyltransferase
MPGQKGLEKMQQIIAGSRRGRKLSPLAGNSVRPTAQRTRAALFNILAGGRYAVRLEGAVVLDMFAGTGALGLEALSRGAGMAIFVEQDMAALAVLRRNIERLDFADHCRVIAGAAEKLPPWRGPPVDIMLMDAPYDHGLTEAGLAAAWQAGALSEASLVLAETRKSEELALPAGFQLEERRLYGVAALHILSLTG